MDSLDKKTMIHIAAELVIVVGIAFWLNSKISAKDEKIEALEKQVKTLTEKLDAIENFLKANFGRPQPPPQKDPKPKQKQSGRPPGPLPSSASEEEEIVDDEEIEI